MGRRSADALDDAEARALEEARRPWKVPGARHDDDLVDVACREDLGRVSRVPPRVEGRALAYDGLPWHAALREHARELVRLDTAAPTFPAAGDEEGRSPADEGVAGGSSPPPEGAGPRAAPEHADRGRRHRRHPVFIAGVRRARPLTLLAPPRIP